MVEERFSSAMALWQGVAMQPWRLRRGELLRGPLYYVLILAAVTVTYWRESAAGLLVIALMCGGDGLADIVGRRFGAAKLPHNHNKSWAGSLAMFLGAPPPPCTNTHVIAGTVSSTSQPVCACRTCPNR